MAEYESKILTLLTEISGEDPTDDPPVLSAAQFHAEVLRHLEAIASDTPTGAPVISRAHYHAAVLELLSAWSGRSVTAPVFGPAAWKAEVLAQLGEISEDTAQTGPALSEAQFRAEVLRLLGIIEDSGLPEGFTKLKGLSMNNDCYFVITDFRLKGSDTLRFSFSATDACNVLGCYTNGSAQTNYSLYVGLNSSAKYMRYNGGTYDSRVDANTRYNVLMSPTGATGLMNPSTWTEKSFDAASDFCVGTTSTGATSAKLKGSIYGPIKVDGRLNLIPCINGSNVAGYYDTYSETFFSPAVGTPTPIT